jgi:ferrous iron transport protein B
MGAVSRSAGHRGAAATSGSAGSTIALIGHSNVGKSALFHRLTGLYTPVSNYPGTTVEVARGAARMIPATTIVDTPGVLTLPSTTEDERVTARILLNEPITWILHVGDARNLRRTLLLSLQLAETGLPMCLALNMMDEANRSFVYELIEPMESHFGIQVVPTVATRGEGLTQLQDVLHRPCPSSRLQLRYAQSIESALDDLSDLLPQAGVSARALGLLWLAGDPSAEEWLASRSSAQDMHALLAIRQQAAANSPGPLEEMIERSRRTFLDSVLPIGLDGPTSITDEGRSLADWMLHPVFGLLFLTAVLLGLYLFVGVFGAGTLVDLLEGHVFAEWLNPMVEGAVRSAISIPWLADMFVGPYGLWTVGVTYAFALILPIVTTFFVAFGVLEDSGYLPRLSVLANRSFRRIGLNGRAVLPMILGLGCVTMATMSTRILEERRDRLMVILLLSLAIPCSAQLGVVMGMLGGISLTAALVWLGIVLMVLLGVGWLATKVLPGESTPLIVELPRLRWPSLSNILIKTAARLEWYMREVVPLFILGALAMFILEQLGVLAALIRASKPIITGWLGLPPEASVAFVMGFLRRDFGATGLFMMDSAGLLTPRQVVVSMVTITLFVPCIASVLMIAKERGWRTAAAIVTIIFPLAFSIGGLLNIALGAIGW